MSKALYKLQSVLVPLTLAIGFAQLFQPDIVAVLICTASMVQAFEHFDYTKYKSHGESLHRAAVGRRALARVVGALVAKPWLVADDYPIATTARNSYKIKSLLDWLKNHGVDISKMDWSSLWDTFRGQLMDTLNATWRYLLWKTVSSAVIGAAVGFCLEVMQVGLHP
eukprot:Skav232309  [mRNA]  locus=scaffold882:632590:652794:- [translate_table: standard]